MCGLRYGSPKRRRAAAQWMAAIERAAYRASIELAREKGAFPLFDRDRISPPAMPRRLPEDIRDGIATHGIRNAPSHLDRADRHDLAVRRQRSSGIEPVFNIAYERKVLMPDGSRRSEQVEDYAGAPLSGCFTAAMRRCPKLSSTADDADARKSISSCRRRCRSMSIRSISKTINCPAACPSRISRTSMPKPTSWAQGLHDIPARMP